MWTIALAVAFTIQGGSITGVVRTPDGMPAAGARVAALSAAEGPDAQLSLEGLARTDSAGQYRFENLPKGNYYLAAGPLSDPTYFPGTSDIAEARSVSVGANAGTADFQMSAWSVCSARGAPARETAFLGAITAATSFKVKGRFNVVSGSSSSVAGAVVLARRAADGGKHAALVDVDGSFQFELPSGEFRLTIALLPLGFSMKSIELGSTDITAGMLPVGPCAPAATAGSPVAVTLVTDQPLFGLVGRVVQPSGSSTSHDYIDVIDDSGFLHRSFLKEGAFEFRGLAAGAYTLRLTREDREALRQPIEIKDQDITVELRPE